MTSFPTPEAPKKDQFNICYKKAPTTPTGKDYWVQLGRAFPSPKGGFTLYFDSLPGAGWDGRVYLFPDKGLSKKPAPSDPPPAEESNSEDIPF